jgi:hypothetical protein
MTEIYFLNWTLPTQVLQPAYLFPCLPALTQL